MGQAQPPHPNPVYPLFYIPVILRENGESSLRVGVVEENQGKIYRCVHSLIWINYSHPTEK